LTALISADAPLDGEALRQVFAAASAHLRESAKAVDAINVYPVPDGDTGSNMSATLREAVDRALALDGAPNVAQVLEAIARGALYGARGNSGVILSQALRGFAAGVGGVESLDGRSLASGFARAAEQAYRAVGQPQEGTMLTVLQAAGEGATRAAAQLENRPGSGCVPVLSAAVRTAEEAEAFTIEQLPALKEAGVPDAGGEGVCVILRGLLGAITGAMPLVKDIPAERPIASAAGHEGEAFGFCTEFLIEGENVEVEAARELASAGGNRSVVVVGERGLVRVHAHALEPQALLDAAEALGTLSRIKVEDMSAQNVRYRESGSGAGVKVALLAMSRGAGFDAIFESLGATVSDLGLAEKPPAGQIADAAGDLRVPDVVVLPNHKNVLMAAELAKSMASCTLHVVPTVSLPQGIAAAMAFAPGESAAVNLPAMAGAAARVRTIEVTIAGASRRAEGIDVTAGEAIALLDGDLVATAKSDAEALLSALELTALGKGSLVTLYPGEEVDEAASAALAQAISEKFPGSDVETVPGGQPLYRYIASIE